MCGRFRLTRPEKLAERFGIEPEDDWVPRYNIAPTQDIPVIRQHAEEPLAGFGSSDCNCETHLFFLKRRRAGL